MSPRLLGRRHFDSGASRWAFPGSFEIISAPVEHPVLGLSVAVSQGSSINLEFLIALPPPMATWAILRQARGLGPPPLRSVPLSGGSGINLEFLIALPPTDGHLGNSPSGEGARPPFPPDVFSRCPKGASRTVR